ncbi:hypothetical protein [Saccharothrix lopnurensis]|uniref:Uncharacterized protein n=1 Tax=Saccharothrix lopnurensis TaxID=1670621 RepID=A0ABW1P7U4_9PSEU
MIAVGLFGRSSTARSVPSSGHFTREVDLDGTCGCGRSVSTTGTVTTVLGETGDAAGTVTCPCGCSVTVTGTY